MFFIKLHIFLRKYHKILNIYYFIYLSYLQIKTFVRMKNDQI